MSNFKMLLKPLVGARILNEDDTKRARFGAPSFSLDERQNYVKIVTSPPPERPSQVTELNNNILLV